MKQNFGKNGLICAVIMWISMYIHYAIDYFQKTEVFELVALFLYPILLSGYYLYLMISRAPDKENVKSWYLAYSIPFTSLWLVSYFVNMLIFLFVPIHTESLRLIGSGISFYGFTALIGFSLFALIVQGIRNAIKKSP